MIWIDAAKVKAKGSRSYSRALQQGSCRTRRVTQAVRTPSLPQTKVFSNFYSPCCTKPRSLSEVCFGPFLECVAIPTSMLRLASLLNSSCWGLAKIGLLMQLCSGTRTQHAGVVASGPRVPQVLCFMASKSALGWVGLSFGPARPHSNQKPCTSFAILSPSKRSARWHPDTCLANQLHQNWVPSLHLPSSGCFGHAGEMAHRNSRQSTCTLKDGSAALVACPGHTQLADWTLHAGASISDLRAGLFHRLELSSPRAGLHQRPSAPPACLDLAWKGGLRSLKRCASHAGDEHCATIGFGNRGSGSAGLLQCCHWHNADSPHAEFSGQDSACALDFWIRATPSLVKTKAMEAQKGLVPEDNLGNVPRSASAYGNQGRGLGL